MSIRKDKDTGIWQISISIAGQKRYQRSSFTTNRKQAQELHDKIKQDMWRQVTLGEKPKSTWADLVDAWLNTKALDGKRSLEDDRDKLRWLSRHFNDGDMLLADIDSEYISNVLEIKRKEGRISRRSDGAPSTKPLSNATINRYAALIGSMMEMAKAKSWVQYTPSISKMKEVRERISYLTHEQAAKLLKELPEHLVPLVRFSLATGLRQHNVTTMQWANVNIDQRIAWTWADEAKGAADLAIPLNDDALAVLIAQKDKSKEWVFPNANGIPYPYPAGKAFHSALKRAGMDGFHWHDLRHTWATWHVQNGTPLEVLQKLGGWKSLAMVLRYAHLGKSYLADHASNISLPTIAKVQTKAVDSLQISSEHQVNR